ncbi:MAG: transporter substrate-binding domain-containing protein [Pseudomonadota bacterium]
MVKLWHRIVMLFLAVIACAPGVQADALSDVRKRGTMNIGVSMFLPWTMEGKEGLIGFEIDVARKVAADLGVTPNFIITPWDDILPALQEGKIDLISAGISITAKRTLQVSFSSPYSSDGTSIVANRALTAKFLGLEDFNRPQVSIAAVRGTVYGDVARAKFARATFAEFLEPAQAQAAVRGGDVHAYAASGAQTAYLARAYPDVLDAPLPAPLRQSKAAFAVRRGEHSFVDFLDAWIIEHEASGWLAEKRAYWFDSLAWAGRLK